MESYTTTIAPVNHSANYLYLTLKDIFPTGHGQISHERLGKLIGKCRRQVIRLCDILECQGLITITRAPRNSHIPNTYTIPAVTQRHEEIHEQCHTESVVDSSHPWTNKNLYTQKDSDSDNPYTQFFTQQQDQSDIPSTLMDDWQTFIPTIDATTMRQLLQTHGQQRVADVLNLLHDRAYQWPKLQNPEGWAIWAMHHYECLVPHSYDLAGNCLGELQ